MRRSSIEFAGGGVATVWLLPRLNPSAQGADRQYRLDVFQGERRVSLLCGRDELRRFAAILASYTASTPAGGVKL